MIKIPNSETRQFSQPNNSDLFGSIWYTENINFDEEGYAKLASRCIQFKSEEDDANFNLPISFGRAQGEFHIVTSDQAFNLSIVTTDFSITEDTETDDPALVFDSWGKWFQNRWHATTNTGMKYTTGGAWTDTGVSLTASKVHCIEVFRNRNTICVGNGNKVEQFDTSYADISLDLTIPADFEVIGLAYSNGKMGVATKLSDTAAGQNQEAYFFQWDGASTSAGQGLGVGSDAIVGIVAYKSSWALLTRTGELKYFNGGGFETLATFPFYVTPATWGDSQNREAIGDNMFVEGDLIFINIGNDFDITGKKGESYLPNNPAGIWCFDPKVGLYHRYAPSISPAYFISVLSAGINTTSDIITANSGTLPATGNPIKQVDSTSSSVGGLIIGKVYYIIKHTATTFSLATTKANAEAGVKVNLTSANDAKFLAVDLRDYNTTRGKRTGGIGRAETRSELCDHLLFGVEIFDYNSTTDYQMLQLTVPGFPNRGALITAKVLSEEIEDMMQKVFIKYRPLDTGDKIVVKVKHKDVLGIPTSTPQFTNDNKCTWTDENTLSTTEDLSEVKAYLDATAENECEVKILNGAGAGQTAKISSLSESGGTYTINLAEDIDGVSATNLCDIMIDNWKEVGSIDSTDDKGWKEFPIGQASKWLKVKIELRGSEVTLEEATIINETQTPGE